jgi:hypothetical protein
MGSYLEIDHGRPLPIHHLLTIHGPSAMLDSIWPMQTASISNLRIIQGRGLLKDKLVTCRVITNDVSDSYQ